MKRTKTRRSITLGQKTRFGESIEFHLERVAFIYLVYMSKPGDEGDEFLQNTTRENLD